MPKICCAMARIVEHGWNSARFLREGWRNSRLVGKSGS